MRVLFLLILFPLSIGELKAQVGFIEIDRTNAFIDSILNNEFGIHAYRENLTAALRTRVCIFEYECNHIMYCCERHCNAPPSYYDSLINSGKRTQQRLIRLEQAINHFSDTLVHQCIESIRNQALQELMQNQVANGQPKIILADTICHYILPDAYNYTDDVLLAIQSQDVQEIKIAPALSLSASYEEVQHQLWETFLLPDMRKCQCDFTPLHAYFGKKIILADTFSRNLAIWLNF